MGLSDDEYEDARARHDAGEISLAEAEEILEQDVPDPDGSESSVQKNDDPGNGADFHS